MCENMEGSTVHRCQGSSRDEVTQAGRSQSMKDHVCPAMDLSCTLVAG